MRRRRTGPLAIVASAAAVLIVTLPVTGGTGDYELARGTVNIALGELDGAGGATLTFDLTTT
jgi:hypothetical protein